MTRTLPMPHTLLMLGAAMVVLGLALNAVLQPDSLGYGAARLVGVGGVTALLAALLQWVRVRRRE